MPDFEHIVWLQHGSVIQQRVFHLLHHKKILYHLSEIKPVVAGTIPLDLYLPGESDVDILGYHHDLSTVEKILLSQFSSYPEFHVEIKALRGEQSVISRFLVEEIPFEIFVQAIPVKHQYGYRHLLVEHWLLSIHGEAFRRKVTAYKKMGMKTEPAFALALGLEGDPYEKLLDFERDEQFLKFYKTGPTL